MTSLLVQSIDLARDDSVSRSWTISASVGVVLADDLARVESRSVYSLDVAVRDFEDPDNPARAVRVRADDLDELIGLLGTARERLHALGLLAPTGLPS